MPDPTISVKDMQEYGYAWDVCFRFSRKPLNAFSMRICPFILSMRTAQRGLLILEDLQAHAQKGGLFGVEKGNMGPATTP